VWVRVWVWGRGMCVCVGGGLLLLLLLLLLFLAKNGPCCRTKEPAVLGVRSASCPLPLRGSWLLALATRWLLLAPARVTSCAAIQAKSGRKQCAQRPVFLCVHWHGTCKQHFRSNFFEPRNWWSCSAPASGSRGAEVGERWAVAWFRTPAPFFQPVSA
jgi:hypothetical protein